MPNGTRKVSRRRENLTQFGEWYYSLREYIGASDEEIAKRAQISRSTISKATRDSEDAQTSRPELETVEKIYVVIETIAREKELDWSQQIKDYFFNSPPASYSTPEQAKRSSEALEIFKQIVGIDTTS